MICIKTILSLVAPQSLYQRIVKMQTNYNIVEISSIDFS